MNDLVTLMLLFQKRGIEFVAENYPEGLRIVLKVNEKTTEQPFNVVFVYDKKDQVLQDVQVVKCDTSALAFLQL